MVARRQRAPGPQPLAAVPTSPAAPPASGSTAADVGNEKYLDVRALARQLGVEQVELVHEMQDDGLKTLWPVTEKRWRVEAAEYADWRRGRQAKAAAEAEQRRLRRQHVAGAPSPERSARKPRFRR